MKSVFDKEFAVYGKVIEGYDFAPLLRLVRETSEKPADHTIYVPSDPTIEALPVSQQVAERVFGWIPVKSRHFPPRREPRFCSMKPPCTMRR